MINTFKNYDLQSLKKETKTRVDDVMLMIKEKNANISDMKKEASKIAADEKSYAEEVNKLDDIRSYLDHLIAKISYTQI